MSKLARVFIPRAKMEASLLIFVFKSIIPFLKKAKPIGDGNVAHSIIVFYGIEVL